MAMGDSHSSPRPPCTLTSAWQLYTTSPMGKSDVHIYLCLCLMNDPLPFPDVIANLVSLFEPVYVIENGEPAKGEGQVISRCRSLKAGKVHTQRTT